jgi:CRP/FNR family transcriptional regulator, cyclic AMP receptor protein
MPQRGSPSQPSPNFTGVVGKRRLLEALCAQLLVAHDRAIAKSLSRHGELETFSAKQIVLTQGDSDNDVLFILHGEVLVFVNGRQVAVRTAGSHVGEISLVDPTTTRSATVVAGAPTVVLRVAEHKFSRVAGKYPDLWRRVAIELGNRLKERNRALRQPHTEPMLFIGSSKEGEQVVEAIHENVKRKTVPRPWTKGVFQVSSTAIESLVALAKQTDFAVLVLTPDDVTVSRGKKKPSPRDNVVFELGLLIGALGRERVFILKPRNVDVRIPTDLFGVTWLDYRRNGPGTLRKKLTPACRTMLSRIKDLGPR